MSKINQLLNAFIESTRLIGLNEGDIVNAQEYLKHNEFGRCFDTLITQLYEFDIEINNEYYSLLVKIADSMNLPEGSYSFMKELVRSEHNIPKPVKEKLASIIDSLG